MGTTSVQTMSGRKHENSTRLSGHMSRYSPSRKDKEESNSEVSRGRKSNKKNLAEGVTRDVSGSGRAVVQVAIVLRALSLGGSEIQVDWTLNSTGEQGMWSHRYRWLLLLERRLR